MRTIPSGESSLQTFWSEAVTDDDLPQGIVGRHQLRTDLYGVNAVHLAGLKGRRIDRQLSREMS